MSSLAVAQPAGMSPAPSIMGPSLTSGPRAAPPAPAAATPGKASAPAMPGPSAAEVLRSQITVQRVARDADGAERLEPVTNQAPGDLIQVNVQYTNAADRTVTGTDMTLPIPPGTSFVPRSVKDKGWTGSRDGTNFTPLTGGDADKAVRQIRLRVEMIPPRKKDSFTFRVRVDGQPGTAGAAPAAGSPPP
jgi:uncharacterized repeat protein (TIGR01451 family)